MTPPAVAIVAWAGITPGAATLEDFWAALRAGHDAASEPPPGRWCIAPERAHAAGLPVTPPDRVRATRACFVTTPVDPPDDVLAGEAWWAQEEPLVTWMIETARRAWRPVAAPHLDPRRVGVVLGHILLPTAATLVLARRWAASLGLHAPPAERVHALARWNSGRVAGAVAQALGLGGPHRIVDAACSSTFYALAQGVRALQRGDVDAMLVGGGQRADSLYTQVGFSQLQALSTTGVCRPFDHRADGLVVGEGAAVFALRRLADARRDGQPILAIVRGIGLSNDRRGGLLVPQVEGQVRAIEAAYREADCSPASIDLLECHATGTPRGDATELTSLHAVWSRADARLGGCALGAVKANVGHWLTGAGAAALAKVLLCLHHREIPPLAHFERWASGVREATAPFRVPTAPEPWTGRGPLRAALSGFGFGGTNAHVVLEAGPGEEADRVQIAVPAAARRDDDLNPATASARRDHGPANPTTASARQDHDPANPATASARRDHGPANPTTASARRDPDPGSADPTTASARRDPDPGSANPTTASARQDHDPVVIVGWSGRVGTRVDADWASAWSADARAPAAATQELDAASLAITELEMPVAAFGGPPRELEQARPQQLLALLLARRALAGLTLPEPSTRGVFVGTGLDPALGDLHLRWLRCADGSAPDAIGPPLDADRTLGGLASLVASRIARLADCGGPSFTTSSEETSGLTALGLAVEALRSGELEAAIVAAVEFAADPRIEAFELGLRDREAPPRADGGVVLVLMRASQARAAGNPILGTVLALAEGTGGVLHERCPPWPAQVDVIRRALAESGRPARDVDAGIFAGEDTLRSRAHVQRACRQVYGEGPRGATGWVDAAAMLGDTGHARGLVALAAALERHRAGPARRVAMHAVSSSGAVAHGLVQVGADPSAGSDVRPPERPDASASKGPVLRIATRHVPGSAPVALSEAAERLASPLAGRAPVPRPDDASASTPLAAHARTGRAEAPTQADTVTASSSTPRRAQASRQTAAGQPGELSRGGGPSAKARPGAEQDPVEAPPRPPAPGSPSPYPLPVTDLAAYQRATQGAHAAYLALARQRLALLGDLLGRSAASSRTSASPRGPASLERSASSGSSASRASHDPPERPATPETLAGRRTTTAPEAARSDTASGVWLDRAACQEFAVGRIGAVLGPAYAAIDAFPTRVRLPDAPLMLVDRMLAVEGVPRSLGSGRLITEHDVVAGAWYLDGGCIPTCIAVEAGQADLFLSAYLGIDEQTRGLAMYRLLDATIEFHAALPGPGETIRYDIRIERFFRQGDTWLFRFAFDATVAGRPLLSMRDGCAGFFTPARLAAGQGVVPSPIPPSARPARLDPGTIWRHPEARALGPEALAALRRGDLAGAFGPAYRDLPVTRPLTLPGGDMALLDRVTLLDPTGGPWGGGRITGEYDVCPDAWFLRCHFVDDQVMPGTLMYECCLHTLRVLLLAWGWIGEADEVVFEPIPGVRSRLECRGQVLPTTRVVGYDVAIRERAFADDGTPYVIADATMSADGRTIVRMSDMTVRLRGTTRARLDRLHGRGPERRVAYERARILAFAEGRPSDAFGPPYAIFDEARRIARLPRPPFLLVDRIVAVEGEPFVMKAGARASAEVDLAPHAWFFDAARQDTIPFAVLLEIALQPCGWLAAYVGSPLQASHDLRFRNLGGEAQLHAPVDRRDARIATTVTLERVSHSGGMILQHFRFACTTARHGCVYDGTTYFGYFSDAALAAQVGLREASPLDELAGAPPNAAMPLDPPFPDPRWRMIDRIEHLSFEGGVHGHGRIRGSIEVDPSFWFFQAHFYQDPVWPGSLGLQAALQLLQVWLQARFDLDPHTQWATTTPAPHRWVYRGQVLPSAGRVVVDATITAVDEARRRVVADAILWVDGRPIYEMRDFGMEAIA